MKIKKGCERHGETTDIVQCQEGIQFGSSSSKTEPDDRRNLRTNVRELNIDGLHPLDAYEKIKGGYKGNSFLLESVEGSERRLSSGSKGRVKNTGWLLSVKSWTPGRWR